MNSLIPESKEQQLAQEETKKINVVMITKVFFT